MKSISMWLAMFVIGIVVIIIGILISYAGIDTELRISDAVENVDRQKVYFFEMAAAGGKPINVEFDLSAGNMTVAFLSVTGFNNLQTNGTPVSNATPESNEVFKMLNKTSSGELNFTPDQSGTYYTVFYNFSEDESSLNIEGSYSGNDMMRFLMGIVIIIVGSLIVILGMILRRKQLIAERIKRSLEEPRESAEVTSSEDSNRPIEPPIS